MLGIGQKLPSFKVTGVKPKFMQHEENGVSAFEEITEKSFDGKWKVIYFYPKDFTFVCPTEIAEFAKLNKEFEERDAVVLGGSTMVELNRASSPNSGRIVSPTITPGGALVVTNAGAALQTGDTFQLFSAAVSGFSSVSLPATDANQVSYTWDNKLALDGTIVVLTATGAVNPNPTNIVFSTSAGALTLEWPDSHLGWMLQTNAVGLAATNEWYALPDSTQTNRVFLTIDRTKTNVFYRLVHP